MCSANRSSEIKFLFAFEQRLTTAFDAFTLNMSSYADKNSQKRF